MHQQNVAEITDNGNEQLQSALTNKWSDNSCRSMGHMVTFWPSQDTNRWSMYPRMWVCDVMCWHKLWQNRIPAYGLAWMSFTLSMCILKSLVTISGTENINSWCRLQIVYYDVHSESKKLGHFYFYCNFVKCWPILIILSLSEPEIISAVI